MKYKKYNFYNLMFVENVSRKKISLKKMDEKEKNITK